MMGSLALAATLLVGCSVGVGTFAEHLHPGHDLHEWRFTPQPAAPHPSDVCTSTGPAAFEDPSPPTHAAMPPLSFKGLHATDRRLNLLSGEHLPAGPFTLELWINHHASKPLAVTVAARDASRGGEPAWLVGFHDHTALFAAGPGGSVSISSPVETLAHHQHWYHLAAVFTGQDLQLFVNGRQFGGLPIDAAPLVTGANSRLEIAAYLEHEPHMQLGHLVTFARLYDEALTASQVAKRFSMMKIALDEGWGHPGQLHLSAGPFLRLNQDQSMQLLWETDRPTSAVVDWGLGADLTQRLQFKATSTRIQHATLPTLKPATQYSYRIRATDPSGTSIDSGTLTFRTPPIAGQTTRIGMIGAAHLRPHISEHLAAQMLPLRPDALINLGPLTDGGGKDSKHLWNLEYFRGIGLISAQVPTIVLPGDGDADRFWFDQYHPPAAAEGCSSIRCGDAEFFLLDTAVATPRDQQEATCRAWLKHRVAASTAPWKIVCHHRPFFSSMAHADASPAGDHETSLNSLFDELGIDLVLSALPGGYERSLAIRGGVTNPEGVIYVNTGGGGADPISFPASTPWHSSTRQAGHHFVLLEISPQSLHLTAHGLDGTPFDRLTLAKSTPATQR